MKDLIQPSTAKDIFENAKKNKYLPDFYGKTPQQTLHSRLGELINNSDARVKRIKTNGESNFLYYLTENESKIDFELYNNYEKYIDNITKNNSIKNRNSYEKDLNRYLEKSLHTLLATYLDTSKNISKTISHEKSNNRDDHQKWIHPDMISVSFFEFKDVIAKSFLQSYKKEDSLKISSYEIKQN